MACRLPTPPSSTRPAGPATSVGATPAEVGYLDAAFEAASVSDQELELATIEDVSDGDLAAAVLTMRASSGWTLYIFLLDNSFYRWDDAFDTWDNSTDTWDM